jgi:peptide deformylase
MRHAAPGVGLAAPQVGKLIRMFVYDDGDEHSGALCNPVIVWASPETTEAEEGCLSIPGTYFPVTRATSVRVEAFRVDGSPVTLEAQDFLARIFQHEIDHLDGIMFIDRLEPELRKAAQRALMDQDFGLRPPPRRKPDEEL